mmetsp:Transcript_751/g.1584  ORF Transcript_751/g.1584 Transcript_751/m.1584 type:complete len:532 (-) Transcript_751:287-1882(-)
MKALFRLYVVSLVLESTVSLNHANFFGDGKDDKETVEDGLGVPDFMMPEGLFEFFAPLPHPPTHKPTQEPTHEPTVQPTAFPVPTPKIPAGRFPSPIASPTANPATSGKLKHPPTSVPAPIPAAQFPQQNVASPTPPVAYNNQKHPPTFASYPHPHPPPTKPVESKIETRVTSYVADWGSNLDNCEYVVPTVVFTCMDGGSIEMTESKNAKCAKLSNDRVECTQNGFHSDPSIGFECSGITNEHLMSTATVGSSIATKCQNGGKAVKFLSLRRKCLGHIDINPTCTGGIPWMQEGVAYCASPAVCSQYGICTDLTLESITMSNTNKGASCSRLVPTKNIQENPSHGCSLASITQVDWRISGQKRGCLWKSPPLLLRCQDGGKLEFMENYPFCFHVPERNMAQCQTFAPYSAEKEESIEIRVKCTGESENQLVLSAEIPSEHLEVECNAQGTIIQSIMLSRGCGEYGTDRFTLINHPSFCDAQDQIFAVDDNHAYCFVGDTCIFDDGCNNIHLAPLIVSTDSDAVEKCTFVV